MTNKESNGPLVESPVRVALEADATEAINKLADAGITLMNATARPIGAALSALATDILDVCRGPFQRWRIQQLIFLAKKVKELQEVQGVVEPNALPPKAQQLLLEQASFVEGDQLRSLWAQLIVNSQAGLQFDAYLFELLSKLSADDVQVIADAAEDEAEGRLDEEDAVVVSKLAALGLAEARYRVTGAGGGGTDMTGRRETKAELRRRGHYLTPLGHILWEAASRPFSTKGEQSDE